MSSLKLVNLQEAHHLNSPHRTLQNSINDDFVMVQAVGQTPDSKMNVKYVDASVEGSKYTEFRTSASDDCEIHRPRESEKEASFVYQNIEQLLFVVWCPTSLSITRENDVLLYQSNTLP